MSDQGDSEKLSDQGDSEKPSTSSDGKPAAKSSTLGLLVVLGVMAAAVAGAIIFSGNGQRGGDQPNGDGGNPVSGVDGKLESQLAQLRSALAATENLDTDTATPLWDALKQEFPKDPSVSLNRALNRVLAVDALAGAATSALADDAKKKDARSKLPTETAAARAAIDDYQKLAGQSATSLWLKSRIDLHEATLIPVMSKSLRREVFTRLSGSVSGELNNDPTAAILGGPLCQVLDELEDPIDGLPEQLLGNAATSLAGLSDKHPDNLFLAIRAARLNIDARNNAAKTYVDRTYELARAIDPLLGETTKPIGLTPAELVAEITTAITASEWDDASNRMQQWFNVLNPTEILRTDRRRASPHPLDRLSFDTLRRLSAAAVKSSPLAKAETPITFSTTTIDEATDVVTVLPIDFDLDLDDDLATISPDGLVQLWKNDQQEGKVTWKAAGEIKLDTQPTGLLVADLFMVDSSNPQRIKSEGETGDTADRDYATGARHDTFPGLIAYGPDGIRVIGIDGRDSTADGERMTVTRRPTGLEDVQATSVATGDLEGDGDLDLAIATESEGVRLFINRGNRTFFEVTLHDGGFDKSDPVGSMVVGDIDRDLDLDIITIHPGSGRVGILENLLHLQFRGRTLEEIPAMKGATDIAMADLDGNVSWDLVVASESEMAIVFSQTADASIWTVDHIEKQETVTSGLAIADFDNDSWSELLAPESVIRLGPWGIDATENKSVPQPNPGNTFSICDVNSDGFQDFVTVADDKLQVGTTTGESPGHHLIVRFKGIADNNASSGRVNHFAVGSVLEVRFGPHYRSKFITSPATHFGLDGFGQASSIRVIMPNGLTQTIRDPKVDAIVEEKQTLKGSCPYLYAWDGEKYAFITDCLWAAPLGLQVARGVVAKDRPWEYLKVDGDSVQPRDGKYSFRITEELWEVAYFDKLALTAVDHPADVDIWTNEKVGPGEIAEQTVFAFGPQDRTAIHRAVDTHGRDITKKLKAIDRDFVQAFDRRYRQGLCEPHWIDLDFGDVSPTKKQSVFLVLTGWILPTDTSLNIQIDQNPDLPAIEFPSVWVPDNSADAEVDGAETIDGWRKVIPFMGFPGGKTKTIVVDVTDAILPNDPRLRVRTSAQIYWDSAQLVLQNDQPTIRQHELRLLSASVDYHGFSRGNKQSFQHPELYDYQQASKAPKWPPLKGGLTKFGDCVDLLQQWDDSMVVISGGDEIQVEFSVPETPVPEGWKRDFVLHCVGWDKDADLNTLTGQSTTPLPFRKMAAYPPAVSSSNVDQQNEFHLQRRQSFRAFWHRGDDFVSGTDSHRTIKRSSP